MAKRPPVVFFTFANNRVPGGRPLDHLLEEKRQVRKALAEAESSDLCEMVERDHATVGEMWDVFLNPKLRGRIAIFHFAGHAGNGEILLETREGGPAAVYADGLAGFLGQQEGLRVVFLNGCSTEPQVQGLLAAGVPVVIATSGAIGDELAMEFSTRFYQSLASDAPVGRAFTQAVDMARSQMKDPRKEDRSFSPQKAGTAEDWPWKIYGEERARGWKLTARRTTIEVPELLPYLCNREPQETPLDEAILQHRDTMPRRPLAVLIPGDYRQALDRFIDRLQDPTLPRFLGKQPLRRIGPLSFKDSDERGLQKRLGPSARDLAEKLCGTRSADLADMARAVAACNCPVMIDVIFTFEAGRPTPKPKLVRAWLDWLAQWPPLHENQSLIFLLRFEYRDTAPPPRLLFWKKRPSQRVEKLLDKLTTPASLGLVKRIARLLNQVPATVDLGVARLPPLEDIHQGDVLLWIEDHARVFACKQVGEERDTQVCEHLEDKVEKLFLASPSIPMRELAPKLRQYLTQCLSKERTE